LHEHAAPQLARNRCLIQISKPLTLNRRSRIESRSAQDPDQSSASSSKSALSDSYPQSTPTLSPFLPLSFLSLSLFTRNLNAWMCGCLDRRQPPSFCPSSLTNSSQITYYYVSTNSRIPLQCLEFLTEIPGCAPWGLARSGAPSIPLLLKLLFIATQQFSAILCLTIAESVCGGLQQLFAASLSQWISPRCLQRLSDPSGPPNVFSPAPSCHATFFSPITPDLNLA
jgi:hypothetical protein